MFQFIVSVYICTRTRDMQKSGRYTIPQIMFSLYIYIGIGIMVRWLLSGIRFYIRFNILTMPPQG